MTSPFDSRVEAVLRTVPIGAGINIPALNHPGPVVFCGLVTKRDHFSDYEYVWVLFRRPDAFAESCTFDDVLEFESLESIKKLVS
jgi:hypothetical protein